tara:strand:+ start:38 stop:748 length:711 start_codon:yes stop_codon:yes gene_type:complete
MIKPLERNKEQDTGDFKDLYLNPDPVIREDGLPTIDQWEKLLGREGVVTGRKQPDSEDKDPGKKKAMPCPGKPKGMMVIEETIEISPLSKIAKAGKPQEDIVAKADNRHADIINLVESVLKLSERSSVKKIEKGGEELVGDWDAYLDHPGVKESRFSRQKDDPYLSDEKRKMYKEFEEKHGHTGTAFIDWYDNAEREDAEKRNEADYKKRPWVSETPWKKGQPHYDPTRRQYGDEE